MRILLLHPFYLVVSLLPTLGAQDTNEETVAPGSFSDNETASSTDDPCANLRDVASDCVFLLPNCRPCITQAIPQSGDPCSSVKDLCFAISTCPCEACQSELLEFYQCEVPFNSGCPRFACSATITNDNETTIVWESDAPSDVPSQAPSFSSAPVPTTTESPTLQLIVGRVPALNRRPSVDASTSNGTLMAYFHSICLLVGSVVLHFVV